MAEPTDPFKLAPPPQFMKASRKLGPAAGNGKNPPKSFLLPVYRCQLVEERKIVVSRRYAHNTSDCADLLWSFLDRADREVLVVLMMDGGNNVLGFHQIFMGTIQAVQGVLSDCVKAAVLCNAERLVLAHNHPTPDDPRPSSEDKKLTRDVYRASKTLQIKLLDHIVFGRTRRKYYSFLDHDEMPWQREKERRRRKHG